MLLSQLDARKPRVHYDASRGPYEVAWTSAPPEASKSTINFVTR